MFMVQVKMDGSDIWASFEVRIYNQWYLVSLLWYNIVIGKEFQV